MKYLPSAAPACLECDRLGQVVLGTNFRGYTAPDKQGNRKRRVFCRDCDRGWVVSWTKEK